MAILDQMAQMVLDRPARRARGTDDVFDLDLSALLRQLVDAERKFRKLSQNFLLALNLGFQAAFVLLQCAQEPVTDWRRYGRVATISRVPLQILRLRPRMENDYRGYRTCGFLARMLKLF